MKRILVCTILAGVLQACGTPVAVPARPVEKVTIATPVCTGKVQCDAMWILAQEAVQDASGMKIRLLTESRIETFSPSKIPLMTGTVTKYPISVDKYEMRLQLDCYRHSDCSRTRVSGTNLFNIRLARAANL
jgi:hypothetical protein